MKLYLFLLLTVCYARDPFPDMTDDEFENDCLTASNVYRANHSAPSFKIDPDLEDYAKSRCNLTSQYKQLSHGHAGLRRGTGENLFWGGRSNAELYDGQTAIDSWYNEVKYYNYSNPGFSTETGHFTQLVWVGSTHMGCARCGGQGENWYETYIVCNYEPAGNVRGQFEDNVLPG